jgi:hypothetical protein
MAFDVPRTAPAGAETLRPAGAALAPVAPVALVPVQGASTAESNEPIEPPPPPRAGDRPRLTRVK